MSLNVEPIEDALRQWVIAATGVGAERVTWAEQQGPQPTGGDLALSLLLRPLVPPGRDGALVRYHRLEYPSRAWSISAGALVVPAHGLTTGDGPFILAGAVVGARWVRALSPGTLGLAATFFDALSGPLVALPPSGSGTIAGGPDTVPLDRPAERVTSGPRVLELEVQGRGGPRTGSGTAWNVLDALVSSLEREDTAARMRAAKIGLGLAGAVQRLPANLVNSGYLQPFSRWTIAVHATAESVERLGIVQKLEGVSVTVV